MASDSVQGSLFEENYLMRSVGLLSTSADIALTELVANSWDAGARNVRIEIPRQSGSSIVIEDDGTGMTPTEFRNRWMTLGYNRLKHQGENVEFPEGVSGMHRRAYGRNGIGRHGMLCFADEYIVESRKGGYGGTFKVSVSDGDQPFKLVSEDVSDVEGHGTRIHALISRNLPDASEIREIISARFLHDPQFKLYVNGVSIELTSHKGLVERTSLSVNDITLQIIAIDSSKNSRTARQHGVAFWVSNRLVGTPTWQLGERNVIDGRTRFARRYTFVVSSNELINEVRPDWSGFKPSEIVDSIADIVADYINEFFRRTVKEKIDETTKEILGEHREEISKLPTLSKLGVSQFVRQVTELQPLAQPEFLSAAVDAVIHLEKSRTGAELLRKISHLSPEDIDGLNRLLEDWDITDARTVLDEIDKRMLNIEAIERFSSDDASDELRTIHPMILQARWLFGPEFDSPMYTSNVSLSTAMRELFGERDTKNRFYNFRNRPDIIVLEDSTINAVCTEKFKDDGSLLAIDHILIIELKKGAFTIGRQELDQATHYVEDLINSGHIDAHTKVRAFVVGHRIDVKIQNSQEREVKNAGLTRGSVQATTFGTLVSTAKRRLFSLKQRINQRYGHMSDEEIMYEVLGDPQLHLPL